MNDDADPRAPRPFSEGFAWITAAIALFRAQALRLLLIGLLFQLLGGASQVGVLGVLFVLALPALTAGILEAMHRTALGQRPTAMHLFAAFSGGRRLLALFLLGGLTIGIILLVLGFIVAGSLTGLDPDLVGRLQAGDPTAVQDLDPALVVKALFGMLTGLFLGACLSFFTVPLVWFQDRSLGNALLTGIAAMLREWRALTALGLVLAAIGLPVLMLAANVMAAEIGSGAPSRVLMLVLMVVVVVYQVLGYAAQYVAYRAIFPGPGGEPDEDAGAGAPGGDDQLVA